MGIIFYKALEPKLFFQGTAPEPDKTKNEKNITTNFIFNKLCLFFIYFFILISDPVTTGIGYMEI